MCRSLNSLWRKAVLFAAVFTFIAGSASAQIIANGRPWRYLLLSDSRLTDDCPICGRPSFVEPMRGSFSLRLLETNPLFSRYALEDINFTAGTERSYTVKGSGTFQIGGELAITQQMSLQVDIDDGTATKLCQFTNSSSAISRDWPMMDITVQQTNGTLAQTYTLRLAAAPVREMWFSTANFFTAGAGPEASNIILSGDLISATGRIVKRHSAFLSSVGVTPPGPDLGLDALAILPGAEIAFSFDTGFPTSNLGPLQHGDLLSTRGRMIHRNQDLLAPFILQPAAPDTGLDAVHMLDTGDIHFSIETDIFSEGLGATLHRGDLLSSDGLLVRTHKEILAAFHPTGPSTDYGLDALFFWPGGEMWFSTEQGFTDQILGAIAAGDVLSDKGYIAFRNADLLAAFAPVQNSPDFGLDALFIVTDTILPAGIPLLDIRALPATQSIALTWQGPGRVFQIEHAPTPAGPFLPLSPVIPDLSFTHTGALNGQPRGFYRLLQW